MSVALVLSMEVMVKASPLGFGLPRRRTFVALSYRLSSIVVPREARNLLFPHFACRKKSEEARAFPGFLRIDVYRNRSTGNLPALTSSTSPETPPSRHAHRPSAEPQTFTELKLPPISFPHPCAHYVRYVVIPSEARDRFFLYGPDLRSLCEICCASEGMISPLSRWHYAVILWRAKVSGPTLNSCQGSGFNS